MFLNEVIGEQFSATDQLHVVGSFNQSFFMPIVSLVFSLSHDFSLIAFAEFIH